MKAIFPGKCGICYKKFKVGDEIIKVHRQLLGPVTPPWGHKACTDRINRVLAPESISEVSDEETERQIDGMAQEIIAESPTSR